MRRLIINSLKSFALIVLVIIYFEYIASRVSNDLQFIVGVGFLPFVVGIAGALTLRGPYIVKGVFCGLVFPCAMLYLRFMVDANAQQDAESDTFLFFYIIGVTIYVIVVVIFVYFLRVILPEKHLKKKQRKNGVVH